MSERVKHSKLWYVMWWIFGIFGAIIVLVLIFMHFGGFSTGEYGNTTEFAEYAQTIQDITIPADAKIIALGEATHGNAEFQELKLDVFKQMVEKYDTKAFALESDYGGGEIVNQYIHGGDATLSEALEALVFRIYQTEEMAELILYMKEYNETAAEGEDLRFYGFDMQSYKYCVVLLSEACKEIGVDATALQKLMNGENWNPEYNVDARIEIINQVKNELETKENSEKAIQLADILLQHLDLQLATSLDSGMVRDKYMAENIKWILQQEQQKGNNNIFISAHNNHVRKKKTLGCIMGELLSKEFGNGYYVIGTDFYKSDCNIQKFNIFTNDFSKKRTDQVFYSHDPLAKTAKMLGLETCWLDFEKIPANSELNELISEDIYMGNLGEMYNWIFRLYLNYRVIEQPLGHYDSMIFVSYAHPIKFISYPYKNNF
ncbi:erythromycin esterase [Candidatus Epulonipiscium fishelsonii]|uniref:Erythromycin esterase n=1 Tax=Candidatus Epulonipiscium fishelsonii TaxID=77094 RepID=A0ACC8X9W0_9FIRM|nr:erythromycin esterase [Epulopiscium sp. SCG-D08WGA-EpuloA1]